MQETELIFERTTKNSTSISDCPESFAKWYCLNGATCFSVQVQDSTLYNCWCPTGFHGLRCDYKYAANGGLQKVPQSIGEQYDQIEAITLRLNSNSETKLKEGGSSSFITRADMETSSNLITSNKQHAYRLTRGQLIVYSFLSLILIVILSLLILSYLTRRKTSSWKRKGGANCSAPALSQAQTTRASSSIAHHKNVQINHDSISIRLNSAKENMSERRLHMVQVQEHFDKTTTKELNKLKEERRKEFKHLNNNNNNQLSSPSSNQANLLRSPVGGGNCFLTNGELTLELCEYEPPFSQAPVDSSCSTPSHWLSLEIVDQLHLEQQHHWN